MYERARSITPKMQRRLVADALLRLPPDLDDPLPAGIRARLGFPDRRTALEQVHFPPIGTPLDALNAYRTPAQRRLVFEEFFRFQVGLLLRKRESEAERKALVTRVDDRIRDALRAVLPFRLTPGQRVALKEIADDMQRPHPMNRLLQGDVGAGKTIVAVLAAVLAMENGQQVAFMAPTEILAEQHFADRAAAARGHAVPGRPADRAVFPPPSAAARARRSPPARCTWWWARTPWCRNRCGSRRSAS